MKLSFSVRKCLDGLLTKLILGQSQGWWNSSSWQNVQPCGYNSSTMHEDAQECNLPCVYVCGLQAVGAGPPYPGFPWNLQDRQLSERPLEWFRFFLMCCLLQAVSSPTVAGLDDHSNRHISSVKHRAPTLEHDVHLAALPHVWPALHRRNAAHILV